VNLPLLCTHMSILNSFHFRHHLFRGTQLLQVDYFTLEVVCPFSLNLFCIPGGKTKGLQEREKKGEEEAALRADG